MKRCLLALTVLLACVLAAGAYADVSAGAEITPEEITDFYYTFSTSTDPPFFLRYRFYVEDGKKLFSHETREGGGWPQTEEDIAVSGTAELTEADWAAFFACICDGEVATRSDKMLDGDSGPWLYLYWTGDEGQQQEFSFASLEKRFEFEELCSRLAQNHILTRFYISRGGYMVPQSYEITLRNGSYMIQENEDDPRSMDPRLIAELQEVIQAYGLESWDGFHESDPYVLDGEGFWLQMWFADGTSVYASGDNAFPDGYFDAMSGIDGILEREKMSWLAGTYRYEGEGFGGDFTITLNADGTYTFYEGPLSSYLGMGTWNTWYNAVYLTEDEETGNGLEFMFGVEDGALIYVAMGSDEFVYVKVADGERFVREDNPEVSMRLFIGETEVPVTWEDNDSTAALRELLPLTIQMSMYGGFEQVGPIGQSIIRDDRQTVTDSGDIVLYSGNQIVVFYGSNSWTYTRLGHVNLSQTEMAELLGNGAVPLTISAD